MSLKEGSEGVWSMLESFIFAQMDGHVRAAFQYGVFIPSRHGTVVEGLVFAAENEQSFRK